MQGSFEDEAKESFALWQNVTGTKQKAAGQ